MHHLMKSLLQNAQNAGLEILELKEVITGKTVITKIAGTIGLINNDQIKPLKISYEIK